MIDETLLDRSREEIKAIVSSHDWTDLSDEEIWLRLISDSNEGEGWNEEVLISLFDEPKNLREKLFNEEDPKNEEKNNNSIEAIMKNQQGIITAREDGSIVIAKADGVSTDGPVDPSAVKQNGKTNEPTPIHDEIDRIQSQLDKKFSSYEMTILKSSALRVAFMDAEAKSDSKDEEAKSDSKDPKKPEGKKDDKAGKDGDVKNMIDELQKILDRIKNSLGKVDEIDEKLDLDEPIGDKKLQGPEKEEGKEKLKELSEKGKAIEAKASHELEKLAELLTSGLEEKGDESEIAPPTPVDSMDQGSAGKADVQEGEEAVKSVANTQDALNVSDSKVEDSKGQSEDAAMAEDPKPETCDTEDSEVVYDEKNANIVSGYLEKIAFIENFFEDVTASDKIERKIASAAKSIFKKSSQLDLLKKATEDSENVTLKEAEIISKWNNLLADKVAGVNESMMHTAPKADDYGQKDVQKQVAKENIKGNKNNIKNTSNDMDRKFLSVKAQIEKIMTNKFARYDRALEAAGESMYKELVANPLKDSLYRYSQEAGLDADTAYGIIEAAFDEAAESAHTALMSRAKELVALEDTEFLKKASQISKSDKRISERVAEDQKEVVKTASAQSKQETKIANKAIISSGSEEAPTEDVDNFWKSHGTRTRL